jgi:hypothetical protein
VQQTYSLMSFLPFTLLPLQTQCFIPVLLHCGGMASICCHQAAACCCCWLLPLLLLLLLLASGACAG